MKNKRYNTKQFISKKLINHKPAPHPAIKLISLIVVSLLATQGSWLTLFLMGAFMLPFYIVHFNLWHSALKMLFKLKWFFFSILLIYFFFTPNLPVEQQNTFALLEQLLPGIFRITVLIVILFAVNLFIQTTSKEQILAALLWLFSPLQNFHIDVERISLRAILTLEYIEILTLKMAEYKNKSPQSKNQLDSNNNPSGQILKKILQQKKSAFYHLINQSGIILREILAEAKKTSGKSYEIEYLQTPLLIQFIIPVLIFLLLLLTF